MLRCIASCPSVMTANPDVPVPLTVFTRVLTESRDPFTVYQAAAALMLLFESQEPANGFEPGEVVHTIKAVLEAICSMRHAISAPGLFRCRCVVLLNAWALTGPMQGPTWASAGPRCCA